MAIDLLKNNTLFTERNNTNQTTSQSIRVHI